jgi:hypothetical protein
MLLAGTVDKDADRVLSKIEQQLKSAWRAMKDDYQYIWWQEEELVTLFCKNLESLQLHLVPQYSTRPPKSENICETYGRKYPTLRQGSEEWRA